MQFQPMKIAAVLFFVTMPIYMLLGFIDAIATASGLGKVVNVFQVLAFGSLALMIGLAIWERTGLRFDFAQRVGPGAARPGPTRMAGPDNHDGGFSA